jgi:hypothetical protein
VTAVPAFPFGLALDPNERNTPKQNKNRQYLEIIRVIILCFIYIDLRRGSDDQLS